MRPLNSVFTHFEYIPINLGGSKLVEANSNRPPGPASLTNHLIGISSWPDRCGGAVLNAAGPVAVQAPPGFGKRVLAEWLNSRKPGSAQVVQSEFAPSTETIAYIGRLVPGAVRSTELSRIPLSDLRMTRPEVREIADALGVPPPVATAVHLITGGWPSYVTACLLAAQEFDALSIGESDDLLRRGPHLSALIHRCLRELEDIDLGGVEQLSHFDRISQAMLTTTLGPSSFERLQVSGFPIHRTDTGWFVIEEPIRSALRDNSGLAWARGQTEWSSMIFAGFEGDLDGVRKHSELARSLLGGLLDHASGVVFACDAAVALAVCGDVQTAQTTLASVAQRREESLMLISLAEFTVSARGDGDVALLERKMTEIHRELEIPCERSWRLDLELAMARSRSGHAQGNEITKLLEQARSYDLLAPAKSLAGSINAEDRSTKLVVMGGFAAHLDGVEVRIPPGHSSALIKLLTMHGRPVPSDVAIAHLWPDSPTDLGVRRLKNVVRRIRSALGSDFIRRSPGKLSLGSHVRTDLDELRRALSLAGKSPAAALHAIDLYSGHLLPSDLYCDATTSERYAIRGSVMAFFDLALGSSHASAAWGLLALHRLAPEVETPYLAVSQLARAEGDTAVEIECERLAAEIRRNLGYTGPGTNG